MSKLKRIHFIGIGGIGVSALARYYLEKGWQVSGSDLVSSETIKELRKKGVKIFIGKHKAENLPKDCDLVIYTPAIQDNNPELKKAYQIQNTKYKIQILSYPEALGELTKKYFTIAVSGTHGKSTTAAMVGLILVKAGFDPTVILGTKLKEFAPHQKNGEGSNCRVGKSKYLVIEADEHMASFLNYWPKIIVLTNIEKEHLDYYKNLNNILKAFRKYIGHLPKNGVLIINQDDKNTTKVINKINNKVINKVVNKVVKQNFLTNITNASVAAAINVLAYSLRQKEGRKLKKILKIPGEHNVSNALAAIAVARVLKIPDKISFKTLSEYRGSWRRFDEKTIKLNAKRLTLISDYGHHPTEVKVTIIAAREKYPKKEIWCIFQPHQYQRTYYLFRDFVKVFRAQGKPPVDKVIITDIFDVAGRENKEIKKKVNSEKLVKTVDKNWVIYLPKTKILNYLKKNLRGGEVLMIMGAGDIYRLVDEVCLFQSLPSSSPFADARVSEKFKVKSYSLDKKLM